MPAVNCWWLVFFRVSLRGLVMQIGLGSWFALGGLGFGDSLLSAVVSGCMVVWSCWWLGLLAGFGGIACFGLLVGLGLGLWLPVIY